jgi:hypothetical protein
VILFFAASRTEIGFYVQVQQTAQRIQIFEHSIDLCVDMRVLPSMSYSLFTITTKQEFERRETDREKEEGCERETE